MSKVYSSPEVYSERFLSSHSLSYFILARRSYSLTASSVIGCTSIFLELLGAELDLSFVSLSIVFLFLVLLTRGSSSSSGPFPQHFARNARNLLVLPGLLIYSFWMGLVFFSS